jgi:hypothetical protein
MELRVELFARIRRDAKVRGLSIRALARAHNISRRTVRQALSATEPPERRTPSRRAPKLDPLKTATDTMLLADLDAPRKQRHAAQRVFDRVVDEHQAVISYSSVGQYVKAQSLWEVRSSQLPYLRTDLKHCLPGEDIAVKTVASRVGRATASSLLREPMRSHLLRAIVRL